MVFFNSLTFSRVEIVEVEDSLLIFANNFVLLTESLFAGVDVVALLEVRVHDFFFLFAQILVVVFVEIV